MNLEKTDKAIESLREKEEATAKRKRLDPDRNKYEPKMYKRDGNYPPKGTITIVVYPHKEFETTFEGDITGSDVNRAWRMMIRGYRLWKFSKREGRQPNQPAEQPTEAKAENESEVK